MNALKFIIKQRHWLIACATLSLLCLHIGDIRKLVGSVKSEQQHRTELIQYLVESNVSHILSILGASFSSAANRGSVEQSQGAISTSSIPFHENSKQAIAHRFNISSMSSQFIEATQNREILWALDSNRFKAEVHLIAGLVSPPEYFEAHFDLTPYFPKTTIDSNTILLVEDKQKKYFMPSGEQVNIAFAKESGSPFANQYDASLQFTELHLWGLPFFQINSDDKRYFHLIKVHLPQLNAHLFIFDNMTTSIAKIVSVQKNLLEVVLLLGSLYLLMQSFSYFQDNALQALESDTLTGLKNRLYLETANSRIMRHSKDKQSRCIGVITIDLDHFKMVNDCYGHHIGDVVLVRVSEILMESVRKGDECYRIGGDEFIVIIKAENQTDIVKLADRIRDKISTDRQLHNQVSGGVSASLGLVNLSSGQSIEEAIISADKLLYKAKHNGRNLVQSAI